MLTVVTNSRNDDHGGNQLHRLQVFVEGLAEYREMYNMDLELVLVEWNPPEDRPTLPELLVFPQGWVKIFQVPNEVHRLYENADRVPFFFHLAHTTGIRRAKGEWVLVTSQDVIFSDRLARWLALGNFDEWTFYRATRFDSDVGIVPDGTVHEWVTHLASRVVDIRARKPSGGLHTKGCGDFILMHKDRWNEMRGGFPEWGLFGVYLDGIALHAAAASGMGQVVLDDTRGLYHMFHESQGMEIYRHFPHLRYQSGYKKLCRKMLAEAKPLVVNDENWGLADCEEIKVASGVWRLECGKERRGVRLPTAVIDGYTGQQGG